MVIFRQIEVDQTTSNKPNDRTKELKGVLLAGAGGRLCHLVTTSSCKKAKKGKNNASGFIP